MKNCFTKKAKGLIMLICALMVASFIPNSYAKDDKCGHAISVEVNENVTILLTDLKHEADKQAKRIEKKLDSEKFAQEVEQISKIAKDIIKELREKGDIKECSELLDELVKIQKQIREARHVVKNDESISKHDIKKYMHSIENIFNEVMEYVELECCECTVGKDV